MDTTRPHPTCPEDSPGRPAAKKTKIQPVMDTTQWEALKTWLSQQLDAQKALADPYATTNTYAFTEACARRDALHDVLAHIDLMELKAI